MTTANNTGFRTGAPPRAERGSPPQEIIEDHEKAVQEAQEEIESYLEDADPDQSAEQVDDETQPGGTGPVGEGDYVCRDGDCMASIANQYGFFWETIWNDPANSELREVRQDPHVLLEDDRVTIPEKRRKEDPSAAESHHRFRRKGEPAKLRLRIMQEPEQEPEWEEEIGDVPSGGEMNTDEDNDEQSRSTGSAAPAGGVAPEDDEDDQPIQDEPRANCPYTLNVEGTLFDGTTDADGYLEHWIDPAARTAELILHPGTENEEHIGLDLGQVNPLSELRGVKQRLANLGFECGDRGEGATEKFEEELRKFQQKNGLPETGEPDQATRDKLLELIGN